MAAPIEIERTNFTRIRLIFNHICDSVVTKCWFLFNDLNIPTIETLKSAIKLRYDIPVTTQVTLYLDDFEIPSFESTKILRDNDLVRLKFSSKRSVNSTDAESTSILCDSFTQTSHGTSSFSEAYSNYLNTITLKKRKRKKHHADEREGEPPIDSKKIKSSLITSKSSELECNFGLNTEKRKKNKKKSKQPVELITHQSSINKKTSDADSDSALESRRKKTSRNTEKSSNIEQYSHVASKKPADYIPAKSISNPGINEHLSSMKTSLDESIQSTEDSSSQDSEQRLQVRSETRKQAEIEAEEKLQDFINNLPSVRRQRRGGRTRKRKSVRQGQLPVNGSTEECISPLATAKTNGKLVHSTSGKCDFIEFRIGEGHQVNNGADAVYSNNVEAVTDRLAMTSPHNHWSRGRKNRRNGTAAPHPNDINVSVGDVHERTHPDSPFTAQLRAPLDYDHLACLVGQPRQGDRIAFKLIEMSSNYEPILSDFKAADVVEVSGSVVVLKLLTGRTERDPYGRFEMGEAFSENELEAETDMLQLNVSNLLDVRAVSSAS